jgi:hypothetical protein
MLKTPSLLESTNDSRQNAEGQNYLRFLDTHPEYFLNFDDNGKAISLAERLSKLASENNQEFDHQINNILLHAFSHMEPAGCGPYSLEFVRFSGGITDILLCLEASQSVSQLKQINLKIVQGYSKHLEFDDGKGDSVEKVHGYYSQYLQLFVLRKYIQNYNKSEELKSSFEVIEAKLSSLQQKSFIRFKTGYKEFYQNYINTSQHAKEPFYDYLMTFESMSRDFLQLFKQPLGFQQDQTTFDTAINRFLPNADFESIFDLVRKNIIPEGYSLASIQAQEEIQKIRKPFGIVSKLKKLLFTQINLPTRKK